jgi:hypothetical protein
MGFFGMLFWIVLIWLAVRAFRSWNGCGAERRRYANRFEERDSAEDQRAYIESLESRVAELEERLDFTERLVAGRSEAVRLT